MKFVYDTGASSTVMPIQIYENQDDLEITNEFYVANGEAMPNYGWFQQEATDEKGNPIIFGSNLANVNRPLFFGRRI